MSDNYLILRNNIVCHYFYRKGMGICFREQHNEKLGEIIPVYNEGSENFSVYCDGGNNVHIICTNENHEIVYLSNRQNEWNRYIISSSKDGLTPLKFMTMSDGTHLNLLYSAVYKNEPVLIHCILGANAQPSVIDKLYPSKRDFFLFNKRVYYTNSSDILGYKDFADGKPDKFIHTADNGYMPYLTNSEDGFFIVYKQKHKICFENTAVFEDFAAEFPILTYTDKKLILQWKSGGFVRYITSTNNGKSWSTPMRFVNPGRATVLFTIQDGDNIKHCYGSESSDSITLFAKPTLFPKKKDIKHVYEHNKKNDMVNMEIQKLKIMIELLTAEVSDVKKQIKTFMSDINNKNI